MDWNNYNTATSDRIRINWTIATILSTTIMAFAMAYIVTEWCLQSHLSTANLTDASRGLFLTRRFRWLTSPFRDTMHHTIEACYAMRRFYSHLTGTGPSTSTPPRQNRRSVRWTRKSFSHDLYTKQLPSLYVPLEDLTPGRPRASSDAPLMQQHRDASASPSSVSDSRPGRSGSLQSPRASAEGSAPLEGVGLESPSRLHVREARAGVGRRAS